MGWLSSTWNGIKDIGQDIVDFSTGIYENILDPLGVFGINDNGWLEQGWTGFKHLLIPDMRRDREAMVNSSTTARKVVYGRARVGGQLAYAETTGEKSEHFHVLVLFAGHAVDGYDEIWFDDKLAATVSGGVVTLTAAFTASAAIELFDGTQTTACASMIAASAGNWTADHKLLGCAYGYFKLTYSEGSYPAGLPSIKAVIRGKRVYDPRTTAIAWSDNPMLCIRDYMLTSAELGGMGCDADEIDNATVIGMANICDQLVAADGAGGTEKRYTLNGSIGLDGTPAGIVRDMLTSCAGTGVYTGAVWRIYAGAPTNSVATLDESWLNGGIGFKVGSNKGELINTVKGTFVNSAEYWESTEFPVVSSAAYLTEDAEEELTADISLPFTTSSSMAQRMAKIVMEKSRRGFTMSYPCNMKAFKLEAWDVVSVNNSQLGLNATPFRINSWNFGAMSGVNLSLTLEDPEMYGWTAGDPTFTPTPGSLILPNPTSIAPPTGLDATPSIIELNGGATSRVDLFVYWSAGAAGLINYQVQYQLGNTAEWTDAGNTTGTSLTITGLPSGLYNVRVRGIDPLGTPSSWSGRDSIVLLDSDSEPLSTVTGFAATFLGNMVKLTWNSAPEADRAYYEIRQGATWDAAAIVHTRETSTEWLFRPSGSGTLTYLIKTFDVAGNSSLTAASVNVVVPVPGPVTAIVANGVLFGIELTITYPQTADIGCTEIWAATTNDRNAAVMVGITRNDKFTHQGLSSSAIRYYWARTYSVFEEYSTWYPVSATAGVMGATVANPSEIISLLNSQVDPTALENYINGVGSFSDVLDTYTPAAQPGVGQTGVFATKGQMLIQADRQIQLKAGSADVSAQVDILSSAIGAKLNATGTVGAGMLISWTDESHTKSQIQFWSDTFQICKPDGTGVKPVFTVGNIAGVSTVGISGDMVLDGAFLARHIGTNQLVVGTNVSGGAGLEGQSITTIVGGVVDTDYVNALNVTAAEVNTTWLNAQDVSADRIVTGTLDATQVTISGLVVTVPTIISLPGFTHSAAQGGANVTWLSTTFTVAASVVGKAHIAIFSASGTTGIALATISISNSTQGTVARKAVAIEGISANMVGMAIYDTPNITQGEAVATFTPTVSGTHTANVMVITATTVQTVITGGSVYIQASAI